MVHVLLGAAVGELAITTEMAKWNGKLEVSMSHAVVG